MRRPRLAVLALGVATLAAACGATDERQADEVAAARGASSTPLAPVVLPDLSRVAADVRDRLRSTYTDLQTLIDSGAPPRRQADAYGVLGKLLLAAEYLDEAGACFAHASMLSPEDPQWPYLAGHVFRLSQRPAEAAAQFERAASLEPRNVMALLWLADMHLVLHRVEAAEAALERARPLAPEIPALHDALGRTALARRDYAAAAAHLERALAAEPSATRLHYRLGLAYRGIGDRARAEAQLRLRGDVDVARTDPVLAEVADLLQNAASYEIRAARALEERRWSDAIVDLRKAAELAPANAIVRLNLGNALYQHGDAPAALDQLRTAVRLDPRLARAHYSIGVVMDVEGRDAEAIDALSAAVAADPDHAEARLALAEALRRAGQVEAALPHYLALTHSHPELSQAVFGRAMAHVRLGRYREARAILEEGLRAYPDQAGFAHALARLLAAAPDNQVRDGSRALGLVSALASAQTSVTLAETMAMALAELGRFDEATKWQRAAIASARETRRDLLPALTRNLASYERRQPCRLPWADDDPIHRPRIGR
jgi:tetratricopeptide (TPR) repeat protein